MVTRTRTFFLIMHVCCKIEQRYKMYAIINVPWGVFIANIHCFVYILISKIDSPSVGCCLKSVALCAVSSVVIQLDLNIAWWKLLLYWMAKCRCDVQYSYSLLQHVLIILLINEVRHADSGFSFMHMKRLIPYGSLFSSLLLFSSPLLFSSLFWHFSNHITSCTIWLYHQPG